MRAAALAVLAGLLLGGCAGTAPSEPPVEVPACGGTFADGFPAHCEQKAAIADVEAAVPEGWLMVTDFGSTRHERNEYYRSPTGDTLGYWFEVTPRSEGDFRSPHPPRYGGFLRVADGPLVAWESEESRGFVRYPLDEFDPTWPVQPQDVRVLVYVPIVNSAVPSLANGTLHPLWAAGRTAADGDDAARAVLRVSPEGGEPFLIHDGMPGFGRIGYSLTHDDLGEFHIYQVLSGTVRA